MTRPRSHHSAWRVPACAVPLATFVAVCAVLGCASVPGVPIVPGRDAADAPDAFSLTPMLPGWERIAPEDSNHPDADLVLRHDEAAVIMIGYVHRDPTATLDWVVLTRREIVAQSREILTFEETRRMMPGPEFNVVSTARYRIETIGGWMPVLAAAVRGRSVVIELIAFGGAPPVNETLFEDLIAGLEVRGSGES